MVLQVFRYNPISTDAKKGYTLGVRVYRSDAFQATTALLKNPDNVADSSAAKIQKNPFAGGLGARRVPLIQMRADISDIVPKYTDLCARSRTPSNNGCS
jgi:hypothetical protein